MKAFQTNDNEILFRYFREAECDEENIFKIDTQKKLIPFCGFTVINDIPTVIFPKNYMIKNDARVDDVKNSAKLLLDTFRRYRYRRNQSSGWLGRTVELEESESIEAVSTRIDNILSILEDFKKNGYLYRKHRVISQTKPGRIMWNKTIQKSESIISHRQIIYSSPYMVSNMRHEEEMVQKIHRYLVGTLVREWGWLLNMSLDGPDEKEPCSPEDAKRILKRELTVCFIQREINLIRRMLSYYEGIRSGKTEKQKCFLLTKEFEQIWENVCGYVLHNDYAQLKDDVPKAEFIPSEGFDGRKHWPQRPDILCQPNKNKNEKDFYILDAKYYSNVKTLGWEDVRKQIIYELSLRCVTEDGEPKYDIKANALLLPGKGDGDKSWKYYGEIKFEGIPEFEHIQVWYLNVRDMLEAYVGRKEFAVKEFFDELKSRGCYITGDEEIAQ